MSTGDFFTNIADLPFFDILLYNTPDVWAALALTNHRFMKYVHAFYRQPNIVADRRRGDFWKCAMFYCGNTGVVGCHEATTGGALGLGHIGHAMLLRAAHDGHFLTSRWCRTGASLALKNKFYDCAKMFADGTLGELSPLRNSAFFREACTYNHLQFAQWMFGHTEGMCGFQSLRADCGDLPLASICTSDDFLPLLCWLNDTNQIGEAGVERHMSSSLHTAATHDALGVLNFLADDARRKQNIKMDLIALHLGAYMRRPLIAAWVESRQTSERDEEREYEARKKTRRTRRRMRKRTNISD